MVFMVADGGEHQHQHANPRHRLTVASKDPLGLQFPGCHEVMCSAARAGRKIIAIWNSPCLASAVEIKLQNNVGFAL